MSEKTESTSNNSNTLAANQVWKNPGIVKAVSNILTEIISENSKEISKLKTKGIE